MNHVHLFGNVGNVPETKVFDNGQKVATFNLATNEYYKNKAGEKIQDTTWHNVVAYYPFAEIVEKYVQKGKQLLISGKIRNRSYEAKDGTKRYVSEIIVKELNLIGSTSDKPAQPNEVKPGENDYYEYTRQTEDDGSSFNV